MNNLPTVKSKNELATTNTTGREIIQLATFELQEEKYGVDVLSVREIIRLPAITKMPNSPSYVEGIFNLRGSVVPVISLRRRFGLPEAESDRRARILVMEVNGLLIGFIVDAVDEVIRLSASEIQPAPATSKGDSVEMCIDGIVNHTDRLLVVLNLDLLLDSGENGNSLRPVIN